MQLYQLFERTIKIPHEFSEDIYRMVIYSIYLMHTRGSNDNDGETFTQAIEELTGLDMAVLAMEFEGRIRRTVSAKSDYSGLSLLSVEDIPYYHSSSIVKDKLDSMSDDTIAMLVNIMIRDSGASSYNDKNKTLQINANTLSVSILRYWFDENEKHKKVALSAIKHLKSVIDHEVQHVVQEIALPSEQSSIKPNYYSGERDEEKVHPDYFTSNAEIRPQLANLASEFKILTNDEYWEYFSTEQKKMLFKMYVGLQTTPFWVEIGDIKVEVRIPSKPYFNALKKDTPTLYKKIVKDFYNMVSDIF